MDIVLNQLPRIYSYTHRLVHLSTLITKLLPVVDDDDEHRELQLVNLIRIRDFRVPSTKWTSVIHPHKAQGSLWKRGNIKIKSQKQWVIPVCNETVFSEQNSSYSCELIAVMTACTETCTSSRQTKVRHGVGDWAGSFTPSQITVVNW